MILPKLSIITPTAERGHLLKGTEFLLKSQTHTNWEWLIYDTSLHPSSFSDPRIHYIFDKGIVTIGEKRNRLIEKATGEIIVHFDDDDFYASTYLASILKHLEKSPFFTLDSWFTYDTKTAQFYYWDTREIGDVCYCVSALSGSRIREIELGPYMQADRERMNYKGKAGYGFSFAYSKEVSRSCCFKDLDLAEDRHFFEDVQAAGYALSIVPDRQGETIHVIHSENTSAEFPQYRIPRFLVQDLFPAFFSYQQQFHAD